MKLSTLLIIIYIIIIVIIILIIWSTTCDRNYWKRTLPLQQCPFNNKLDHRVMEKHNVIRKIQPEGVVSYSLFGNYTKYSVKLLESVKIIPQMLPGWYARVYVGIDIPKEILDQLITNDAEVYVIGPNKNIGFEAALWRFGPAGEGLPFISLDADDLFDERIASNTKAWIKSGKPFVSFSKHSFIVPLAAGLWGARPIWSEPIDLSIPLSEEKQKEVDEGKIILAINHQSSTYSEVRVPFARIQEHINSYCEHWFGFDEAYLKLNVWPLFKQYGYYQCSNFHLNEATAIGIIIIIAVMIYSIYAAKKLEI